MEPEFVVWNSSSIWRNELQAIIQAFDTYLVLRSHYYFFIYKLNENYQQTFIFYKTLHFL